MLRKVNEKGGTLVVATFFDPETKEETTEVVRDYDYSDGSRDNDELYYMPIDEEARKAWRHYHGVISAGDEVKVVKGKKVKVGTIAKVLNIREIKDRYGRWVANYAVLDNGQQTNTANCELV